MKNQNNAKAGRKGLIVLILIILAVLILVFGCNRGEEPQEQAAETTTQTTEAAVQTTEAAVQTTEATAQVTYTFRYNDRLQDHYKKHGRDMGFASPEEYLAAANAVIANPDALTKTEKEDGDTVYYVEATNEFVVLSTDGYIRTYFCPDGGKKYFDRQ